MHFMQPQFSFKVINIDSCFAILENLDEYYDQSWEVSGIARQVEQR
jgi:hypothetical protein